MGRPRKHDRHLPPYVYRRRGVYYLESSKPAIRLGEDIQTALDAYQKLGGEPGGGMAALIKEAFPVITAKVGVETKRSYRSACNKIAYILADLTPEQVKPKHIANMKILLAPIPNMANRCLTVSKLIFQYAVDQQRLDSNPALGTKLYPEAKRDRLPTTTDYEAIYAHAKPRLQVLMDLRYLTGQRGNDLLTKRNDEITADGIYFKQLKTGAKLLVEWSPELRAVVERARALFGNVRALTLLQGRAGRRYSYRTANRDWNEACDAAGIVDTEMRDLRAMSGTAAEAQGLNPTALLGHKNKKMTERYLRDRKTPHVTGPSFERVLDIGKNGSKNQ